MKWIGMELDRNRMHSSIFYDFHPIPLSPVSIYLGKWDGSGPFTIPSLKYLKWLIYFILSIFL